MSLNFRFLQEESSLKDISRYGEYYLLVLNLAMLFHTSQRLGGEAILNYFGSGESVAVGGEISSIILVGGEGVAVGGEISIILVGGGVAVGWEISSIILVGRGGCGSGRGGIINYFGWEGRVWQWEGRYHQLFWLGGEAVAVEGEISSIIVVGGRGCGTLFEASTPFQTKLC